MQGHRSAVPSGPFSCHAFCPSLLQHIMPLKRHKELRHLLNKKTRQEKRSPKLYLHNASYTQPVFSVVLISVFRLPITGIMYFGLRQIAALPTRRDPGTKTAKKQSKGMQAPHWPTRSKKARVYKQPVMFI